MQCDHDGIQRFGASHWWNVFCRLFVSKGIVLFLFVAPFFWALLPFAYRYIKKADALIEANPFFLVFARMGISFLLSIGLLLLMGVVLIVLRRVPVAKSFGDDCLCAIGNMRKIWKTRVLWLIFLAFFYAGARILEMVFILGYSADGLNNSQLSALQDYGYFMGLMLALPIGGVTVWLWKLAHLKESWSARIDACGLRGKATTLSSVAFGICVAFLTLSSGMLYICAEEPCGVWSEIGTMTLVACSVAILTNLGAGCKSIGRLIDDGEGSPTLAAILLSSVGINVIMSFLTMVMAFFLAVIHLWLQQNGISKEAFSTIGLLFKLYWDGDGFGWALWIVVGLLASVVAPISQLIGVSWHDKEKSSLARFGVRGGDWLVICGGFEPLLVAVLTYVAVNYLGGVDALKPCWNHESAMNSNFLMFMAVSTVVVIAIVKIVEVWVDKNSAIRNAIFRQARGSSDDAHDKEPNDMLYRRAVTLSLLKLYDKREELATETVKLTGCCEINASKSDGGGLVYLTRMENAGDYFTTDDPFTADVLKAHEKWCEAASHGGGKCMSLKRFLQKALSDEEWKKTLSDGVWKSVKERALAMVRDTNSDSDDKAMPFVVIATQIDAAKYIACWNQLLGAISDSLTNRKIVGQVNRLICDFDPKEAASGQSGKGADNAASPKLNNHRVWRSFAAANRFLSLFLAPEIFWLLGVFLITWGVNSIAHTCGNAGVFKAIGAGFRSLFAINSGSLSGRHQIVSVVCFFVVWLIGGGVLVSVLVTQRRRCENGEFRLWRWLLGKHVIFFGWDENVPALMRKELDENKDGPTRVFIIITMRNADDVMKAALAANIDKWRFYVYRGFYDDDRERRYLQVGKANAIYIMGEAGEEAHDSRVVLLSQNIRSLVADPTIRVHANISDFGLAYQLCKGARASSLHGVQCINFHLNSAHSMLKHVSGKGPFAHVAVIGFGAMGKAVLIQALKLRETLMTDMCSFFVTDDDASKLEEEYNRFQRQFSECMDNCIQVCPYDVLKRKLHESNGSEKWLVVIAKHRSEKGLGLVWDVLCEIGDNRCFELVLNQEVKCDLTDLKCNPSSDQSAMEIAGRRIGLFGFKRGESYMFR